LSTTCERRRELRIRAAVPEDAEKIAALSTQLGYPSSADQVRNRLARIRKDVEHAVLVVELPGRPIVGWVHVCVSHLVESDPEAELGGLVVDEAHRGSGAGRLLMESAEEWARGKGLRSVYLRSNIIRKGAHEFYKRLGYHVVKTQYAFRKFL
jgi:GNAT superfamily N-acetyltransferase